MLSNTNVYFHEIILLLLVHCPKPLYTGIVYCHVADQELTLDAKAKDKVSIIISAS